MVFFVIDFLLHRGVETFQTLGGEAEGFGFGRGGRVGGFGAGLLGLSGMRAGDYQRRGQEQR